MDATNMVFTNKLMDLVFCSGLCAIHSEIGEAHRRGKFVTTEGHSKGSKRSHSILSQDKLDREVAKIKLQLDMMR